MRKTDTVRKTEYSQYSGLTLSGFAALVIRSPFISYPTDLSVQIGSERVVRLHCFAWLCASQELKDYDPRGLPCSTSHVVSPVPPTLQAKKRVSPVLSSQEFGLHS